MKITIQNRMGILIHEKKLRSASEFGRRMTASGFKLSSAQASRYMKDNPPPFSVEFVNHACNVLGVLPNDLYEISIELEPDENIDPEFKLPHHARITTKGATSVASNQTASDSVVNKEQEPKSRFSVPRISTYPKQVD